MAEADLVRQCKIKTGCVRRITKEYHSYETEANQLAEKLNKLRAENTDEATLKKQSEVLEESKAMIPNTKRRLQESVEDIQSFFNEHEGNEELKETEEWTDAQTTTQIAINGVLNPK